MRMYINAYLGSVLKCCVISEQSVASRAAGPPAGAVHVLGAEEAGLRRGFPLAGPVHRLNRYVTPTITYYNKQCFLRD